MTLTRLKPRRSLLTDSLFPTGFEAMFSDLMKDSNIDDVLTPRAEIVENEDQFKINVVFAGFDKDDIKLEFKDNELVVSGQREENTEEKNEKYHLREFRTGKFKRSFYLPDTADTDNVEAELKNGILNVVIPKREKAKVKEISIK